VSVNGVRVNNLVDVARALRDCGTEPYVRFLFETNTLIVLPTAAAAAATSDVLQQHAIPASMSADLRAALAAEDAAAHCATTVESASGVVAGLQAADAVASGPRASAAGAAPASATVVAAE
jgi:hypothetical protein